MKFATNFINQIQAKMDLIDILDHRLEGWRKARSNKVIHASSLTGEPEFCPREIALQDVLFKDPQDEFIPTALSVTFDVGNAIHDLVRENWLAEVAVGDWECIRCSRIYKFSKHPKYCQDCESSDFRYHEVNIVGEYDISGSLDLLVDMNLGKHIMVEVKIMNPKQFDDLKAPLAEHRIRTSLYLHLMRTTTQPEAERINQSSARVLYVSRGHGKKHEVKNKILPFKEFIVDYDVECLKTYLAKGEQISRFRKDMAMPFGVCPTSFVPRVKKCSVAKGCFSGKYPAQQKKSW